MNVEELRIINLLSENNNLEPVIATAVESMSACFELQNTVLQSVMKEEDVYIGQYFEKIVPEYSQETYRKHFRLSRDSMQILIEDISELLGDAIHNMTVNISKKVHFTIYMLANHAVSFRNGCDLFGMSKGTGHLIFTEICQRISSLREKYIYWPTNDENVVNAQDVEESYGIPGVIGCIDGIHIQIKAPRGNPIDYYNRKGFHSVIMQGICNRQLIFTDVYIGMPGRVHDARVYRNSPLFARMNTGLIPEHQHILGDSAYPLKLNLLTPYRDNGHLSRIQRKYNTKHAAARASIERAFGLLTGRFRRLKYLDMDLMHLIPEVICATCVLHNIILKYDGNEIVSDDDDNDVMQEQNLNIGQNNYERNMNNEAAVRKRNTIAEML